MYKAGDEVEYRKWWKAYLEIKILTIIGKSKENYITVDEDGYIMVVKEGDIYRLKNNG